MRKTLYRKGPYQIDSIGGQPAPFHHLGAGLYCRGMKQEKLYQIIKDDKVVNSFLHLEMARDWVRRKLNEDEGSRDLENKG